MAYQKKYFYEFCPLRKEAEVHTVEIWQDTLVATVAERITAGPSPIVREFPDVEHKFQPTRGTGATLSLLSVTDMKFFSGLKQAFEKEFMIIHKVNGSLLWTGYLNSEMYIEPYDESCNYMVTVTANDGFALLDRYRFLDDLQAKYTGTKTIWEIISIIVSRIGLTFTDIRIALSSSIPAMNNNVLDSVYIDCANFYDEDDLPMTMREVLDAVLQPWAAFIIQENGSLYIMDINLLATNSSITYQVFSSTLFTYTGTIIENNRKAVSDIGYYGTGQSIDRSGGTNRQVVVYSPYPQKTVLNESIVTPDEFDAVPENFSTKDGYFYRTLYGHNSIDAVVYEETCKTLVTDRTIHATIPYNYPNPVVLDAGTTVPINVNITGAKLSESQTISYSGRNRGRRYLDGVGILIEGDLLAKVTANPYVESEIAGTVVKHAIGFGCRIGNKYYNQDIDSWTTTLPIAQNYLVTNNQDKSAIGNTWARIGIDGAGLLLKLGDLSEQVVFSGNLIFTLNPQTKLQITGGGFVDNPLLDETWIKNLSIRIVNYDGSEISDNDIEYIGYLDQRIAKEGEKIELICGTQSAFCDRGKLMFDSGAGLLMDMMEITRSGQTFKIEELLLNSLCSNYRENFLTLNAMKLKNNFSIRNILTDTFINGSLMMVNGSTIDYEANTNTCKLVEISADELDIIK